MLVYHDLLGINDELQAEVRQALRRAAADDGRRACATYAEEVRTRAFPGPEHVYGVAPEEMERLKEMLGARAHA